MFAKIKRETKKKLKFFKSNSSIRLLIWSKVLKGPIMCLKTFETRSKIIVQMFSLTKTSIPKQHNIFFDKTLLL